jgi:hypothetical protein
MSYSAANVNYDVVLRFNAKRSAPSMITPNTKTTTKHGVCRVSHNSYHCGLFWWSDMLNTDNESRYESLSGVLTAWPRRVSLGHSTCTVLGQKYPNASANTKIARAPIVRRRRFPSTSPLVSFCTSVFSSDICSFDSFTIQSVRIKTSTFHQVMSPATQR